MSKKIFSKKQINLRLKSLFILVIRIMYRYVHIRVYINTIRLISDGSITYLTIIYYLVFQTDEINIMFLSKCNLFYYS